MARPRNNLAKLPSDVRYRVYRLLEDGAEYDDVREDEIVAAACRDKGADGVPLALHNSTILAFRGGAEFEQWRRMDADGLRRKIVKNQTSLVLVEAEGAADDLARLAAFKLLQICQDKLDAGEDLEPKELAAVSRAVAAYDRNRIAESREDGKRAAAEKEAAYQAKIAELSARVAAQAAKINELVTGSAKIDPATVQHNLDQVLGVRK